MTAADGCFDAMIEAAWFGGITGGPVDPVQDTGLSGGRERGHGEVGVAAKVAEDLELAGDSAGVSGGVGVVKGPVAVDEAEY